MGGVVSPEPRELLDGPALAVPEEIRRYSEERLDVLRTASVVAELELRPERLGRLRRRRDDRRRQIDDPWHARILRIRLEAPVRPRSRMPRLLKAVLTAAF